MNNVKYQIEQTIIHHDINFIKFNRYDTSLIKIADEKISNMSKQHSIIEKDLPFLFEIKAFIDKPTNSEQVYQNISKIRG